MGAAARPAVLVTLLGVVLLLGCGGDSSSDTATFDDDAYPFTFDYPGDWTTSDDISISNELGGSAVDQTAVVIDDSNGIIVEHFQLEIAIDDENIDLAKGELDGLISQVDPNASGETGETGGYPSVSYDAVPVPDPPDAESRLIALFDGDQEYLLNCQSTPDRRDEIDQGCDQAVESLQPK